MGFKIAPQERHILNDRHYIKTRVPVQEITDEMVLRSVQSAGLHPGEHVTVQAYNHEYDRLIAEAEYIVVGRTEEIAVRDLDDRRSMQTLETQYVVQRKDSWWHAKEVKEPKAAPVPTVKRNRSLFEVIDADGKILEKFTKEEGGADAAQKYIEDMTADIKAA